MISATALADQLRAELDRATATMRHIADMIEALDVSSPVMVDVPYRSQWDADGGLSRGDCGPTCVAMLLEWLGIKVRIDDITRETSMGPTNAGQLISAAGKHGLKITRVSDMTLADLELDIREKKPLIALVKYSDFGDQRQDMKYAGLHWVVVVGYDRQNIYIHDPDYQGERRLEGMQHPIAKAMFERAWDNTMPDALNRQALVIV